VPGNKGGFRLSCPAYLFLTFEGINMVIDLARPKGSRLVKTEYKNKKIKNSDTFTLAVNSYTANGGAYPVLGQAREIWRSSESIRKMIIDKIRKDKIIDFKASGNMVYKGID
jgi:2',3'-cyclic-nucleotide 2'-phosphodiesterase/3'-nucleotidase